MRRIWRRIVTGLLLVAMLAFSAPEAHAEEGPDGKVPAIYIENHEKQTVRPPREFVGITITLEDTDGTTLLADTKAGWHLRGRTSAQSDKPSYSICLSGSEDLLGMGRSRRWVLISNIYDKTLMRNKLAYDLALEIGVPYGMESRYVDLYVDGNYRGNYLLMQPARVGCGHVNTKWTRNEYLLELLPQFRDPEGVLVTTPVYDLRFTINQMSALPEENRLWLEDFLLQAETALQSGDRQRIETYFDTESFVNVYLIYELSKNPDIDIGSTRFVLKNGKLYAGPVWDFDLAFGNGVFNPSWRHVFNDTTPHSSEGWYAFRLWWGPLMACDWFAQRFAERYLELQPLLVNLYEDNELGRNRIDRLAEAMAASVEENYRKWSVSVRYYDAERIADPSYEANVESMRAWLRARNEWIVSRLQQGDYPGLV